jgi:hypothetical protein
MDKFVLTPSGDRSTLFALELIDAGSALLARVS